MNPNKPKPNPSPTVILKERIDIFTSQLKNTALFLLTSINRIIVQTESYKKFLENITKKRQLCQLLKDSESDYSIFYHSIMEKYPYLPDLIERLVASKIELAQLSDFVDVQSDGTYIIEPIKQLWYFMLRFFYEKPILISNEDNATGDHVQLIKDALPIFIVDSIKYKYTKLTEDVLKAHNISPKSSISLISKPKKKKEKAFNIGPSADNIKIVV